LKSIYAKFLLFFIRPALDEHRNQLYAKPTLDGNVWSTTGAQQEAVKRDIRGRFAKKSELHR
jgi:hypothetical protein